MWSPSSVDRQYISQGSVHPVSAPGAAAQIPEFTEGQRPSHSTDRTVAIHLQPSPIWALHSSSVERDSQNSTSICSLGLTGSLFSIKPHVLPDVESDEPPLDELPDVVSDEVATVEVGISPVPVVELVRPTVDESSDVDEGASGPQATDNANNQGEHLP